MAGNVLLDISKPKSYKQVVIQFTGRSYVHWTETETIVRRSRSGGPSTRNYSSTENYVNESLVLWNSEQSQDVKLAPGHHNFPFQFDLPSSLPSPFEGTVGNIRYTLTVKIFTGLLKCKKSVEFHVPVQAIVNVSAPRLLQPVRREVGKTVESLCCAAQRVALTVALPKTGFCIGHLIQVHTSLENGSNRSVTITASVVQRVTYSAEEKQKSSCNQLVAVRSTPIRSRSSKDWDPTIEIPTAGVAIIQNCRNITVNHFLNITCQISFAGDLTAEIPIELGTCHEVQSVPVINPAIQQGPPQLATTQTPPLQPTAPPLEVPSEHPHPTAPPLEFPTEYPQPTYPASDGPFPPFAVRDDPPPYSP